MLREEDLEKWVRALNDGPAHAVLEIPIGSGSSTVGVARAASVRALVAKQRGEYVAHLSRLPPDFDATRKFPMLAPQIYGVTREQALLLLKAGAKWKGFASTCPR